jgi:DNA-binding GntR family transcriptional regulator
MSKSLIIARTAAPLRQQVVRLIREDILNGLFAPGRRLFENVLCETYGVSRTVIREALRQLESEQLIQVRPNLGPLVAVLSEADIQSLYVVRAALEGLAGKLFALNATATQCEGLAGLSDRLDAEYRRGDIESRESVKAEFYRRLAEGSDNAILSGNLQIMHARVAVFRRYAFIDPARIEPSIREIQTIIKAAAVDRDPDAAWAACQRHIRIAGDLAVLEYRKRALDVDAGK